jgi:hypothetical protein
MFSNLENAQEKISEVLCVYKAHNSQMANEDDAKQLCIFILQTRQILDLKIGIKIDLV